MIAKNVVILLKERNRELGMWDVNWGLLGKMCKTFPEETIKSAIMLFPLENVRTPEKLLYDICKRVKSGRSINISDMIKEI
jgi:hypothetical protein